LLQSAPMSPVSLIALVYASAAFLYSFATKASFPLLFQKSSRRRMCVTDGMSGTGARQVQRMLSMHMQVHLSLSTSPPEDPRPYAVHPIPSVSSLSYSIILSYPILQYPYHPIQPILPSLSSPILFYSAYPILSYSITTAIRQNTPHCRHLEALENPQFSVQNAVFMLTSGCFRSLPDSVSASFEIAGVVGSTSNEGLPTLALAMSADLACGEIIKF
jgi:hypothetical protein